MESKSLFTSGFEFYGQGSVENSGPPNSSPENARDENISLTAVRGVAYRVFSMSDTTEATLVLLHPIGSDDSLYEELGNIIAGRLAEELGERSCAPDFYIGPPEPIALDNVRALLRVYGEQLEKTTYRYRPDGSALPITLQVLFWRQDRGEVAHA